MMLKPNAAYAGADLSRDPSDWAVSAEGRLRAIVRDQGARLVALEAEVVTLKRQVESLRRQIAMRRAG